MANCGGGGDTLSGPMRELRIFEGGPVGPGLDFLPVPAGGVGLAVGEISTVAGGGMRGVEIER